MKQCKRCNAVLEDSANFCGSCGSSEFIEGAGAGSMPNGNGASPQGGPVSGYQQPNYQQGGPAPAYQQANYQQGGPVPGYQQANYQQGGPVPGYQQANYQQGGPMPGYQQPNFQQPPNFFDPYNHVPPDVDRASVSKSEFLKKYADPSLQKEWRNIAIFFYIASGLSILLAIFLSGVLDVLFCLTLLGLAMGTHLGVNKVCAIILLVLSCLDTMLCVVFYGTPSGWLWILVGVMAVTKIGKINTQYKQFRSGTVMPF